MSVNLRKRAGKKKKYWHTTGNRRLGGGSGGGGSGGSGGGGGCSGGSAGSSLGIATVGVPDEAGGVVLLDKLLELGKDGGEGLGPVLLGLILVLELLEDAVRVELGRLLGLGNVGSGLGGLMEKEKKKRKKVCINEQTIRKKERRTTRTQPRAWIPSAMVERWLATAAFLKFLSLNVMALAMMSEVALSRSVFFFFGPFISCFSKKKFCFYQDSLVVGVFRRGDDAEEGLLGDKAVLEDLAGLGNLATDLGRELGKGLERAVDDLVVGLDLGAAKGGRGNCDKYLA